MAQALVLVVALGVVLILFALFVVILRRLLTLRLQPGQSRQPRIAVLDSASIDGRRRLLLVRRDNVEHLLMIGGPTDVVVEKGITRNGQMQAAPLRGHQQVGTPIGGSIKPPAAPGPDLSPVPIAAPPSAPSPAAPAGPNTVSPGAIGATSAKAGPEPAVSRPMKASFSPVISSSKDADGKTAAAPSIDPPTPTRTDPSTQHGTQPATRTFRRTEPTAPSSAPTVDRAGDPGRDEKKRSNPFLDRVKSAGAGTKITPPASGPAANARTVVPRATGKGKDTARIEPALKTASPDAAAAPASANEPAIAKTHETAPDAKTPAAPESSLTKGAKPLNNVPDAPEMESTEKKVEAPASGGQQTAPASAKDAAEIGLNSSPDVKAPQQALDTRKGEPHKPEAKPDAAEQKPSEPETSSSPAETKPATEGTDSISPDKNTDEAASPDEPIPAANKPDLTNPFEDELAKLLDEMHGNKK